VTPADLAAPQQALEKEIEQRMRKHLAGSPADATPPHLVH
jgi:hypothetical protein